MLRSLEIENFKGVAARQRIDFAPLTLLFGANSAGKSTILQALLYLHELLERGSADVDRTELGGQVLELGGFARIVHRHESERAIILRAEFATPGGLERFGRDLRDFPFADLDDEVESAWLELTVRFRTSPTFRGPLVERAVIGVNGDSEPLVWLETGTSLREGEPLQARVNLGHPLLATETRELPGAVVTEAGGAQRPLTAPHAPADVTETWEAIAIPEDVLHGALEAEGGGYGGGSGAGWGLGDGSGFGDGRSLPVFALVRTRLSALPPTNEPLRVVPFGDDSPEKAAAAAQVRTFLEMIVLGTTVQLVSFLRDAMYIGPLRTIPPRGFLYERAGRITSWADGLAAWDLLLADRVSLVESTNLWLRRLGAGCQVVVQQLFDRSAYAEELSDGHVDKTVRRLLLDTGAGSFVLPSEVGAGVSQIIPVIVAALDGRSGLSLVEQPEIHVHPAVQVALGDLLIDAVTRDGGRRTLLIETHSEHLILRLLRRIRETTEQELSEGAPAFAEDKLSVLYLESRPDGVRVRRLRVDERGDFKDRWPKGFFAERMQELV
ncbi:MAG: AAA family ATPase [Polyangiaceae bacterium]|jgi:hypothetical protein|nr:AAA family ATPase [Polyangiaceae bacterium]